MSCFTFLICLLFEKLGKIFSKMRFVIANVWFPMDWLGGSKAATPLKNQ